MSTTKQVDKLWKQFQTFIDATAKHNDDAPDEERSLYDYSETKDYRDLEKMLAEETANERQHRRMIHGSDRMPISSPTAAKLVLMNSAVEGSKRPNMPPATIFMMWRPTAAEAYTIGFLIRKAVTPEWCSQVAALDYAKIMRGEQ